MISAERSPHGGDIERIIDFNIPDGGCYSNDSLSRFQSQPRLCGNSATADTLVV